MSPVLRRPARGLARGLARSFVLALALACSGAVHAGRACHEASPPPAANVERALDLALRTAQALEASQAELVVLARAGQDLRHYGLRWSHIGLAYRQDGRWLVLHKLNHCGQAQGDLYRQGLAEFFLDDLFEYRAAIVPLSAPLQQALLPLLRDNARAAALHEPAYSLVAYPWAQRYQQSNQWAIETLAMAALGRQVDRQEAQAWLMVAGYRPTTLQLGPMVRLGARMTAANVAFDDHPNYKRFADRIETTTADSVLDWLAGAPQLAGALRIVR